MDENKIRNITLNYYFKYGLDNFNKGIFYTKIYSPNGTHHIAFEGEIIHIEKIEKNIIINSIENNPKRKNVILLNNGAPINVDLEILDNYKLNMKYFEETSIKNLGQILKMMGLKCSHVTIFQTIPFVKKTMDVHEVDIDHLYH